MYIAQIKSILSSAALKRVKHLLRHDVCDWSKLKKRMELAFNRKGLKYETIHAKFLMREQHMDESFASYHEELWALCDEMTALRAADDVDPRLTEVRVINQFALGIHDRLVRSDVKRYVAQNRTSNICSIDVLETASDAARDHAVEELYTHTYRESVQFLSKRVEEKGTHTAKVKVANLNPQPERTDQSTPRESQHRGNRYFYEQQLTNGYHERIGEPKRRHNRPVVCYRCHSLDTSRKDVGTRESAVKTNEKKCRSLQKKIRVRKKEQARVATIRYSSETTSPFGEHVSRKCQTMFLDHQTIAQKNRKTKREQTASELR